MLLSTLPLSSDQRDALHDLIEANRGRALWSLPRDYVPSDIAAARRVLERIAARGDRATWIRARRLLRELLPSGNAGGSD